MREMDYVVVPVQGTRVRARAKGNPFVVAERGKRKGVCMDCQCVLAPNSLRCERFFEPSPRYRRTPHKFAFSLFSVESLIQAYRYVHAACKMWEQRKFQLYHMRIPIKEMPTSDYQARLTLADRRNITRWVLRGAPKWEVPPILGTSTEVPPREVETPAAELWEDYSMLLGEEEDKEAINEEGSGEKRQREEPSSTKSKDGPPDAKKRRT